MEWTIKFTYAVLLTTATGSILFVIWFVLGRILERMGFTNIVYLLLKGLLIFWMFPLSYLILEYKNNKLERGGGFLFFYTDTISCLSRVLLVVWVIFVVSGFVVYARSVLDSYHRFKNAYECKNDVNEVFDEVCDLLQIERGKVKLLQSFREDIPVSVGVFHPRVVIPDCVYSRAQLEVIFVHELTHYRHRDELLRHITFIISCFHCYNPVMYILKKQIGLWGECSCDYDAVKAYGSRKRYFQAILNMTPSEQESAALASPLFGKKSELEYRILQMKRSKNMSKKSKFLALLCVMTMGVTSTTAIYGATNVARKAYLNAYNATVDEVSEISQVVTEDGLTEYTVSGLETGVTEAEDEVYTVFDADNHCIFDWDVPKKEAKRGAAVRLTRGQRIDVSTVSTPNNVTYRIGIVQPNGLRRYVSGTGGLTHSFSVNQTGTYYVYVQNMSTTTDIDVAGAYSWE